MKLTRSPAIRFGALALVLLTAAPLFPATDWPSFRGPSNTGQVTAPGVFEGEVVGLSLDWKLRLGPGYSGIAVADDRVLTMAADGDDDVLVAIDVERGEELWRYRVGPRTRGHDGSDDGPSVTPVVDGDRVFGASAGARLFAIDAATGREAWSVSLTEVLGVEVPLYEYGSTPLVAGNLVVVGAPGAEAGSLAAFDRTTGAHRWSAAPGQVQYQSAVSARLLGHDQILYWPSERVVALDHEGNELWSAEAMANQDASPLPIGEDRVLLYGSDRSSLLRLRKDGEALVAEKVWESRDLKGGNFSAPVYHDGHIYGFDRAFLSCVDASTGTRRWKSRPPGGSGLILVEDRLVVFGANGDVVIVRATPEAYTEETRLHATDRESLTWPAFADGRVLVRDASHLATLRITDQPTPEAQVTEAEPALYPDSRFGAFVREVETAPDANAKRLLLDEFFRAPRRYPIVEGDLVHFVYRGNARDVAAVSPIWDPQEELPLVQVEGTDFFYRSKRLDPFTRFEYLFRVNLEDLVRDPLNARSVPMFGRGGSESVPDGWRDAEYLTRYQGPAKSRIERFALTSEHTGDEREITVYLPNARPTALMVVVDGAQWAGPGQLFNTLDHLVGDSIAPLAVALVPAARQYSFLENDGRNAPKLARMLAEELVPELRRRFELPVAREATLVLGLDGASNAALYTALTQGRVFGHAVLLEYGESFGLGDELEALLAQPPAAGAPHAAFLSLWNRHGYQTSARGYHTRDGAVALAARLPELGYHFQGSERLDGYGWGAWRVMVAEALERLLPAPR
ncbi:MAG TPA: PQQ-binding-like beta-propeller repeat protein [Thermoanaerobaculia bacterium]|nr:PQQ-binding-like beta-propeller repeat protein [Thermoanaerobaculia bacterium]